MAKRPCRGLFQVPLTMPEIPVEAAKKYGDKTALVTPQRKLSFNELNALSNQCAGALVDLGIKTGDRVVSYYGALMADKGFNEDRKVTFEEVSKATGIHRTTLTKIANQKGYVAKTDVVDKLCAYFECKLADLAKYVPDEDDS